MIDSGTSLTWVPLNNWSTCPHTNKLTPGSSYSGSSTSYREYFSSAQINGTVATDKFYLNNSATPVNLEFLGAHSYSVSGSYTFLPDGQLGLAASIPSGKPGDLFVYKLYMAGIISKNAFSINFGWINGTSSILFGGYDSDIVKNDDAFSWVDLKSSNYWTVAIDDFKYDGTEISLRTSGARLDTGVSYILMESTDFSKLWTQIKKGKTCGYITGSTQRACTWDSIKDFKEIKFKLGDHDMKIPASAYIDFYNNTSSNNTCVLLINSYQGSYGKFSENYVWIFLIFCCCIN